ncbi:ribonuclease R [Alteromonas halophila]|uniref:Ribonuclease R n=1 Tax=Alteromonas halophila TaxID=516698 RepID=A0A918JRR2_9ALTE|nr:ribonuclease R [Alteromonas halophila]GGW96904.1 ribonuclease R [Alteromonas halophila]
MLPASKSAYNATDTNKHSHPIPNRSYILSLLKMHDKALTRRQLAEQMALDSAEEQEGLRRRLRAMERDGQLSFDPREGYSVLREEDKIEGRVIGHRDGFGFLARDDGGDDLLLTQRDMLTLFDGDRVQVRISGLDNRGRQKAALLSVTQRNSEHLVGRVYVDGDSFFVRPENTRISQEIDIEDDHLMGATEGQYVVVALSGYPCEHYRALGKVTEVLGDERAPGMEIDVAIRTHGIPNTWTDEALTAANALGDYVTEADKSHRADLRQLPFVTIDGEDAKDFDDAVYCERNGDGWRLWVAIADVSHYVTPDSVLDKEAQKRGTSVYFPGQVVPMLPEVLSNGLCSLNPHVDRLVLACEMQINRAGNMTSYQFSEAVIHSHARLTYTQTNQMLNTKGAADKRTGLWERRPQIEALYELYCALSDARAKRGSVDFDTQEVAFTFNESRKIDQITPVERNDAHRLIEECMLCANVATAQFLEKMKLPALYRNHHGPQQKKLKNLRAFLASRQLQLAGGSRPTPEHFDRLLSSLSNRTDAGVIRSMMLRSLSQAEYSPDNIGHFGLAYTAYAHFTSPIRRYPDLLVHRAIRSVIRGQESGSLLRRALNAVSGRGGDPVHRIDGAPALTPQQSYPYGLEDMKALGQQCSALSRRADKASWDVEAWLKCDYMREFVGDTFTGTIITVTQFGAFVELDHLGVEGLIHISAMNNDFYHFDEHAQCLRGERTNETFTVGDTVEVQVDQVDMAQRKIAFSLSEPDHGAMRPNKTRTSKRSRQ